MTLYNSSNTQIAQNDDISNFVWDSRITQPAMPSGFYTLRMDVSTGGLGNGSFALDLVHNSIGGSLAADVSSTSVYHSVTLGATGTSQAAVTCNSGEYLAAV